MPSYLAFLISGYILVIICGIIIASLVVYNIVRKD